jgi:hypothetical protein
MKHENETIEEVRRWFTERISGLWPAGLGSLSRRRTPCIREGCAACERGEGHASYVLFGRVDKRRYGVYIPEEITPEINRALENGHHLQSLLHEAAERYARALKRKRKARDASSKRKGGRRS